MQETINSKRPVYVYTCSVCSHEEIVLAEKFVTKNNCEKCNAALSVIYKNGLGLERFLPKYYLPAVRRL